MRLLGVCFALFVALSVAPCAAATRHYYIAAEDVTWDYAPSGMDLMEGRTIPQPWGQKTKWLKTRYIEYTDDTFSVRKPQPEWLGILGPIIRAEVGDQIVVDFLNRSRLPHSIHPHGLRYDKANEGSYYMRLSPGSLLPQGSRFTYHWFADKNSGPTAGQPSSIVWWYHAHTNEPVETNAGLMGPIIVTAKGKAKPDGSPKDVDREFVTCFMIFDELRGQDAGLFHAINGYIFGNLPGLVMKEGDRVRWHLLGMGNERDLHSPHWHGKTVIEAGRNEDVVELLPGSMKTVDMIADNPGVWMFHCHVADHMEAGMMVVYTIYQPLTRSCPLQFVSGEFWNPAGKYTVTVKNTSGKPIRDFALTFEHFLAPQYLHKPFDGDWTVNQSLAPGESRTLEKAPYLRVGDSILGWVFLPSTIAFADGTTWRPVEEGECFQAFWRDQDHPTFEVLPPTFIELNPD